MEQTPDRKPRKTKEPPPERTHDPIHQYEQQLQQAITGMVHEGDKK